MVHKRNEFTETPKDEMRTPPSLFKKLDDRFHFDLDVACTVENCLSRNCYGYAKGDDAIKQDWTKFMMDNGEDANSFYCNPPYNRVDLPKFVEKGYMESIKGAIVVMLLPVDFSTRWWDYCMEAAEWIRIKGRIHFNDMYGIPIKGSPLFDSCVVVFDTEARRKHGFVLSEMDWK